MTSVISLNKVRKNYTPKGHPAIEDIDLEIEQGEFFCLVGPSGCGKSTLLKLIAGIIEPTSGQIVKPEQISMVFQSGALLPWLNAEDNVGFGLKMKGIKQSLIRETAHKYLELVNLSGFEKKYPRELSGGQRQRVGIARALTMEPEVLLLDEPFSALDPLTTDELHQDLLNIWHATNKTILMVSHLLEEAVLLADRVGVMKDGQILQVVNIDLTRPRNQHDSSYLQVVDKIRGILDKGKGHG